MRCIKERCVTIDTKSQAASFGIARSDFFTKMLQRFSNKKSVPQTYNITTA